MTSTLNLKTTSKPVKLYYDELNNLIVASYKNETELRKPFDDLLNYCCRQFDWLLVLETPLKFGKKYIKPDGIIKRDIFVTVFMKLKIIKTI